MMTLLKMVGGLLLLAASLCPQAFAASSSEVFQWNTNAGTVTADISSPLLPVLERVARATGWQVYLEPNTRRAVSAKFQELPTGEALRLLLGDINYALIPDESGSSRLFVFRTNRKNATERIAARPSVAQVDASTHLITNELIVRLKPGANIDDLARALGAKVIGRIDGLNAYRLQFEDAAAADAARAQLASNADVESVDSNYAIERPNTSRVLAGQAAPPHLQLHPPANPEGRVIIGLVDTSVQSLGSDLDKFFLKAISVAGDPGENSGLNHGTAMANLILSSLEGVTKGSTSVQILPVDIYGPNEMSTSFEVARGIAEAVNGGANVVSISSGGPGESRFVQDVIQKATAKNILLFAAKGNEPTTALFYPAADPGVLAVTALDRQGGVAAYANRAPIFSLGAPGAGLVPFANQTFSLQGTSVSTALVSGAVAGWMDANSKPPTEGRIWAISTYGPKKAP